MTTRVVIRGFAKGVKKFEDRLDIEEEQLDTLLPELAKKHGRAMKRHELGMIEIEFLDEPDILGRFFRIGVDPSGMVAPMAVDFGKRNAN